MSTRKPAPGRIRPKRLPTSSELARAEAAAWRLRRARSLVMAALLGGVGLGLLDLVVAALLARHRLIPQVVIVATVGILGVAAAWLGAREKQLTGDSPPDTRWLEPRRGSAWPYRPE